MKYGRGDGKGRKLDWERFKSTITDAIEDLRCHLSFCSMASLLVMEVRMYQCA